MRRWAALQSAAAGATFAAMVATPLCQPRGTGRRVLATVVVGCLHATTLAGVSRRWGRSRAAVASLATVVPAGLVEHVGQRSGFPFGRYRYTSALQPQVAGVPIVVPMAWFAMAVPARETAHAALGRRSNRVTRTIGGAAALTAWDLFLDPQMVAEGFWRWTRPGRYRGVPLTNFGGWFATGVAVMAILDRVLPPDEPAPDLVAEYAGMAAMETVGFAAFFRDGVVAVVGGLTMLPIAVASVARLVGHRP